MRADCVVDRNGYLGLKQPHFFIALVTARATVCSMYPSIGRLVFTTGSFFGGSLCGSFKFQYVSGSLKMPHDRGLAYATVISN